MQRKVRTVGRERIQQWWLVAAGLTLVSAAWWLHAPLLPYLLVVVAATATLLLLTLAERAWNRWRLGAALLAIGFLAIAGWGQHTLSRIDGDWERVRLALQSESSSRLRAELDQTVAQLRNAALLALDAPTDPAAAFAYLARLAGGPSERGLVLLHNDRPLAWAGRIRVAVDHLDDQVSATVTPFYVELHAYARRGAHDAVATALVHAAPPADRLSVPLDRRLAAHFGFDAFVFASPGGSDTSGSGFVYSVAGAPLLRAAPPEINRERVRLLAQQRARERGALATALFAIFFLAAAWRGSAPLPRRLIALTAVLASVAIVPLNSLSGASRLFDPSLYYASLGGPFTASIGALALTAALVLLGLLAILRSRVRLRSRSLAAAAVLLIAGLGPFLLRDLARGITPAPAGVTVGTWLAWEITIFLAGVSVLLAGASAGSAALGARRGIHPALAPGIALTAAFLAPLLWNAPGRWPDWYSALWVAAIASLALARRTRGFVLTAALVAAAGAATLVWGTTARKRVELAQRDVAGGQAADPAVAALLTRFGAQLAQGNAPMSRAELLARYVESDLAASGNAVALTTWRADTGAAIEAEFATAAFDEAREGEQRVLKVARDSGELVVRAVSAAAGMYLVLAVPFDDRRVTSTVVAPHTRLIREDPFVALIGVSPAEPGEPPYSMSMVDIDTRSLELSRPTGSPRWTREGNEVHGDFVISAGADSARAHVEVELRPLDALIPRGALVLLLDLLIVAALWTLNALAGGGFARWFRRRVSRWTQSYRARLTLALFTFFVIPALLFAAWSYRRLQSDDRQSRELLVGETLRSVATAADVAQLRDASDRLASPLLLYHDGELRDASDSLYLALAPLGRYLRPEVHLSVGLAEEVTMSRGERVGPTRALFGYRAVTNTAGERVVLSAPARTDEIALDRRRRDLAVLLAFATVLGALAALGLSGVAARQFSQPIGVLHRAALAIAAGEREPVLAVEPPSEFRPVFSAFRRMASDLSASQAALEEAQRRLAAVIRNVASGVVAVDTNAVVSLANPRADLLLGQPLPPGTPLAAVGSPELTDRVHTFVAGQYDEGEFDLELHGRQLHATLTRLTRGAGGAVLTLDDITELARAQRVLAWGEMARQVAHEIKNPLTPIRLGVQHVRRARADGRADFDRILEQNVGRILGEIDRLDEIARSFSRYGMVSAELPPGEPTDVAAVMRDVLELERLDEGTIEWTVTGADATVMAIARTDELREVLLNLLENARLANARRVDARLERHGDRVLIAVSDDGDGIPAHVLPRIFEPHFSTRTSGSGLGLATSRRVVEGWGGEIGVVSEPGAGARVQVTLRVPV